MQPNKFYIGERVKWDTPKDTTMPPGEGVVDSIYTGTADQLCYRVTRDGPHVEGSNRNELMDERWLTRVADVLDERTPFEKLISAANVALAHLEGRRHIFSTREPTTVVAILRSALGERVNEHRGEKVEFKEMR